MPLDRDARLHAIRTHIAIMSKDEDEAQSILQELMLESWEGLIVKNTHRRNIVELPCLACKQIAIFTGSPLSGICKSCYPKFSSMIIEFGAELVRAKKKGLPATLTLREWYQTVNDFHGCCAYCHGKDSRLKYGFLLEHFIPIDLGGGTTKENCVPSCYTCNGKKRQLYPMDVLHLFTNGEIQRVQEYLKARS